MTAREEDDQAIARYALVEGLVRQEVRLKCPGISDEEIESIIDDSHWEIKSGNLLVNIRMPVVAEEVMIDIVKVKR